MILAHNQTKIDEGLRRIRQICCGGCVDRYEMNGVVQGCRLSPKECGHHNPVMNVVLEMMDNEK